MIDSEGYRKKRWHHLQPQRSSIVGQTPWATLLAVSPGGR
jgi:hypothetical protein